MKTVLKIISSIFLLTTIVQNTKAQNTFPNVGRVGIATTSPNSSAILDVDTTGLGVLMPRMTKAQRDAIASPANGLIIFQTNNTPGLYYYDLPTTTWNAVSTKAGANKSLSNLTDPTAINQSLNPAVTDAVNLGSPDMQWHDISFYNDLYYKGIKFFGNPSIYKTYLGYEAGINDVSGATSANTGFGFRALNTNTGGSYNTAMGLEALYANSSGSGNSSVGYASLHANYSGSNNNAIGNASLYLNTTGSDNNAMGKYALYLNTSGFYNIGIGSDAGYSNTIGNRNIFMGFSAGYANTTGSRNVFMGAEAGASNTAISDLVAVGDSALAKMNSGSGGNVAVGSKAAAKLTSGNYSTYIGWKSGYKTTTGNANTAVGANSLASNISGYDNIAMGVDALFTNNTGSYNTIIGKGAGTANSSGSGNASLGVRSLYLNSTGSRNTAMGDSAGYSNSSGSNNTFVGAFTNATTGNLTNATAIGYNAKVQSSNSIILGDSAANTKVSIGSIDASQYKLKVTHASYGFDIENSTNGNDWEFYSSSLASEVLGLYNNGALLGGFDGTSGAYSALSDERLKTDIKEMPSVLKKINELKPVTYQFKNTTEGTKNSLGFIAQEVNKIFPEIVSHVEDKVRGVEQYMMDYTGFGVIAIKGIQELQQVVKDRDATISAQQLQLDKIQAQLIALSDKFNQLENAQKVCCNAAGLQPSNNISQKATLNSPLKTGQALLRQNTPNPFNQNTVIKYFIPIQTNNALLKITSNTGQEIKSIALLQKGDGQINLDAGSLPSGTYQYSLFVDGKMVDSKKMVILK